MKKYNLICLFFLAFASCTTKSNLENSFEQYGLNQKVKSIRVLAYKAESKFGEIHKGELIGGLDDYQIIFDNNGLVEEKINFNGKGNMSNKEVYTYDEKYRVIKVVHWGVTPSGSREDEELLTYDGNFIKSYEFHGGLNTGNYKQLYKNNGIGITEIAYYKNDNLTSIEKYELNKDLPIKCIEYDASGKRIGHVEYRYNEDELLINQVYYDVDGKEVYSWACAYNKDGKPIKKTNLAFDDKEIVIEYNEKGLIYSITNAIALTDGTLQENIVTDINFYDYEYDENGNWIKRISYEGKAKIPDSVTERTIVYK